MEVRTPYTHASDKLFCTLLQSCRKVLFCLGLVVLILSLGACSLPRSSSSGGSTGGSGKKTTRGTKPYTIRGKTYHPLKSAHGFTEDGIASWYGKDFHGKLTANGERYNMYDMTAAHKLLPFGTQLKVTNKRNGKSIIVRVNDRGPFVNDRIIDLTRTGAEKLDMIGAGTAPVMLEAMNTVPTMEEDGNMTGNFYVQIGAFKSQTNAQNLVAKIKQQGLGGRSVYSDNDGLWRVQAGPYPSLFAAQNGGKSLKGTYPSNFVVAE